MNLTPSNIDLWDENLLHIMRAHLIRSQFTVNAFGSVLTNTLADILFELSLSQHQNTIDLAKVLGLDKSSIFRGLKQLSSLGYIKPDANSRSRLQRRPFKLTTKGTRFLQRERRFFMDLIQEMSRNLSRKELVMFATYLKMFTDSIKSPAISGRVNSVYELIDVSLDRLTRGLGITSGNFVGSGQPVIDWVLLSEIHYAKRNLHEIAQHARISESTLASILKRYSKRGLIKSSKSKVDHRVKLLSLDQKGFEILSQIESCAKATFVNSSSFMERAKYLRFIELFGRYVGRDVHYRALPIDQNLRLERVVDTVTTNNLRWLFVRSISLASSKTYPLGSTIFAESNAQIAIFSDQELIGGLELALFRNCARVINFFSIKALPISPSCDELISTTISLLPKGIELDCDGARQLIKDFMTIFV